MKQEKGLQSNWYHIIWMSAALLLAILFSSSVGSADLSMKDSFKVLLYNIPGFRKVIDISEIKPVYLTIIHKIRLPRILIAGMTGGGLAFVGGVFQGLFRNPLADPHILGISSGAAFGATLSIVLGIQSSFLGLGMTGLFAFVGAILTILVVYWVASVNHRLPVINLLLTGTAVSSMLSAVISLLMALNRNGIERVYMWTLGSFSSSTWTKAGYLFLFLIICGSILMFYSKDLNLLATGEETAESLGIDVKRLKQILIIAASFLVAACVCVSGIIGFVGLIIPHCVRLLGGPNHRRLLPFSLFGGAIFMILCDTLARVVISPGEVPVGVVTSILGAPYFIVLIGKNKGRV